MSLIIHIESATDICSVALGRDGLLVGEKRALEVRQHISKLSVLIDELLTEQHVTYSDLAAVAVSSGPGSYTGLRVGYATAKGLCLALNIPLIEVDTLYRIAWGMKQQSTLAVDLYVPMIDARRMEVYAAHYNDKLEEIRPAHAWILDQDNVEALLKPYERILFGGNGAFKIKTFELEVSDDKKFIINDIGCNSSFLVDAAWQQYQSGDFGDLAYCEPTYLKPPNITKPKGAKKL